MLGKLDKIPTKLLLALVFTLLASIVFLLRINQKKVDTISAWWNDSWTYRKAINIGWTGSALTDFQVSFEIDTTDTSRFQADCDDIRVTDHRGSLLPHWIEENNPGCGNVATRIWTKVPTVPSSGATIYIYYGNSSAPNIESGDNVFEFFDDFNSESIDTIKWAIIQSASQSSGNIFLDTPGQGIRTNDDVISNSQNKIVEWRFKFSGTNRRTEIGIRNQDGDNLAAIFTRENSSNIFWNTNKDNSWGSETNLYTSATADTWYISRIFRPNSPNLNASLLSSERSQLGTGTDRNITNDGLKTFFDYNQNLGSGSYTTYADWVIVRQYASSDPTTSTASEETGTAPLAYWKFDEGVGSTAHDSIGGNHGTIAGATWQTEENCISGKCLYFDGTDDYVDTNLDYSMKYASGTTFSFWFKPSTIDTDGKVKNLIAKNSYEYSISQIDAGLKIQQWNSSGANAISITVNNILTAEKWYNLSFVYDGSVERSFLYLDGNLISQAGNSQSSFVDRTETTKIGTGYGWRQSPNPKFNGFIDEVKIYSYARTAEQVKSDYAAGLAGMGSVKGNSANIGGDSIGKSLSDGLVGYWKMDEASWNGTSGEVKDASGNGNHGTAVNGATTGVGWFGNGGVFNGSNHTDISNTINLTSQLTISAWVKPGSSQNSSYPGLVGDKGRNDGSVWGYILGISSSGTKYSFQVFGESQGSWSSGFDFPIKPNSWDHLTAIYNSSIVGKEIQLFINGELYDTKSYAGGNLRNSGKGVSIGRDGSYTNRYFIGSIDEVRIYNRALSASEVQTLYNWAPGPVAYWNMDENSGSTINDSSGNSINGNWNGSGNRWATGKLGSAAKFNGIDDYITVANRPNNLTQFTNSFWFNIKGDGAAGYNSFFHYFNGGYNRLMVNNSNNQVYFQFQNSTDYNTWVNYTFNRNQWYYFTILKDSTNYKIFVDGIKVDEKDSTGFSNGSNTMWIGRGGTEYYNGLIDDVRIYNYARTPKQILEDMNARSGAQKSTLPIAHWKFDEGYGTTARDSIGTNNGTFGTGSSAPSWTNNGKFGKALSFDKTKDQYLYKTDSSNSPLDLSIFTISAWINLKSYTGTANNGSLIISKGNYPAYNYRLATSKIGAEFFFDVASNIGGTFVNVQNTNQPSLNTWYHVVGVSDGSNLKLYVNGISVGSTNLSSTSIQQNNNDLVIGKYGGSDAYEFDGILDEIKVYNYALTPEEVKQDYNQGFTAVIGQSSSNTGSTAPAGSSSQEYCVPGDTSPCSPPVAEWKFEEGVGTTAFDISGNNNHGIFGSGSSAPSWTMGKTGTGLDFTNLSTYVTVPDIGSFGGSTFTIQLWFKTTVNNGTLISCGPSGDYWKMNIVNGKANFAFNPGGATSPNISTETNYNDGNWHHFVGVRDAARNGKIYIDGVYVKDQDVGGASSAVDTPYSVYFGALANLTNFLDGQIDQVRIYRYARTPAQIAWDYNRGAPVGHWRFDECQGTTAHDVSGNHGTITIGAGGSQTSVGTCTSSGAWYNGRNGKLNSAMSFDGTDDYINMGDNLEGFSSLSISAWINSNDLSSGNRFIAGKEGLYKIDTSNNVIRFLTGNNWAGSQLFSNTTITTGSWYHIVATYDGSIKKLFINGIQDINTISTSGNVGTNDRNLSIGAYHTGSSWTNFFNGLIDDVRIYNYALTEDQIKTLYNNGAVSFN